LAVDDARHRFNWVNPLRFGPFSVSDDAQRPRSTPFAEEIAGVSICAARSWGFLQGIFIKAVATESFSLAARGLVNQQVSIRQASSGWNCSLALYGFFQAALNEYRRITRAAVSKLVESAAAVQSTRF
jgi:hypothetical protein